MTPAMTNTAFTSPVQPDEAVENTNAYDGEGFDETSSNTESGPSLASSSGIDRNDATATPNSEPVIESDLPPIAIVGIGLRLPGNISTTDEFWDLLVNKKSTRCRVPESRFNVDAFYSDSGKPGTVNSKYGHYLDVDIDRLDASFFSMSRAEVERLDPHQRLLLEVVWECMESGGQRDWRGKNIGCYVGVYGDDWLDLAAKDPQRLGMYRITSSAEFGVANRLSYEFDLKGPSMTIRTACSSSLIGLHEACQAIYSGSCDSAVVAGANIIVSPTLAVTLTEQGVISPSGICRSFDKKADGYVRAEAVNAVYVKKLSDALRDGDPIRGVIRATGSNFDGRTSGITNPSKESQENLIRRTYRAANIGSPSETGFVECHGTGTAVGDPLETSAVGKVFGGQGEVIIGSVKPNVGHSEGASGLTSVIKAVLALEHETVPPNINFSEPNPRMGWQEFGLRVPTDAMPWPTNRAARVSVNNFGIGGANAHAIIESARPFQKTSQKALAPQQHLLLLSANDSGSLKDLASQVEEYATKNEDRLSDISFTLGARRERLAHRAFAIADETGQFQLSPVMQCNSKLPRRVNFVFTGQGAQWAGMAVELLDEFPSFLADIRHMDRVLQGLRHAPLWSMEEELSRPPGQSRIDQPEFAQPICTAVQIAIVRILRSWNVEPSAVVGHSSGEIAAAYAAGSLTLEAAIAIAYYRGQVTRQQLRSGSMAAVGLGPSVVKKYLEPGVVVACENSARSTTLSGDSDALDSVIEKIKLDKPDCFVRKLKVDKAYHSHHMQEVGDLYEALIREPVQTAAFSDEDHDVEDEDSSTILFSSVTGNQATKSQMSPAYWRTNLESPVLFSSAVESMLASTTEKSLCLEIGPHSALSAPLRDIIKSVNLQDSVVYVPTLLRKEDAARSLLSCLGQLFQHSVRIDMPATSEHRVLTDLPTYPWRRETVYWNESRVSRDWRFRKFPPHELLGIRTLEADDARPSWRNVLKLSDVPWISDHKVKDDVVFPAAGYLAMAGEAVRQIAPGPVADFSLRQVNIKAALLMKEAEGTEIITHLAPVRPTSTSDSAWYAFSIVSHNGSSWVEHCEGHVKAGDGIPISVDDMEIPNHPRIVSSPALYKSMRSVGLNYGPRFQGMKDISAKPGAGCISARVVDHHDASEDTYQLHPTTIDFCLQAQIAAAADGLPSRIRSICMPTYVEEMYVGQAPPELQIAGLAAASPSGAIQGSATAMADGFLALSMTNVRFSVLNNGAADPDADTVGAAQLQWKPDVEFVSPAELIIPSKGLRDVLAKLERLTLLSMVKTLYLIEGTQVTGHLYRFRYWLASQRARAAKGEYKHVSDAKDLVSLTEPELSNEIEAAMDDVRKTGGEEVADLIVRAMSNAPRIFSGEVKPIEVLIEDDGLGNIYKFIQSLCDGKPLFELLSHANPTMKVLEIGAGTGGTTAEILRGFTSDTGERMYGQYDFTDVSPGFFAAAQERFKDHEGIECKVLDISKDPIAQGFEGESYDFIVASNVLHATPSIQATLRNVRKMMKPGGKLFLQELSPEWRMINFIMGFLPGWWLGASDERPDEPYISPARWDVELRNAGFSGTDAVVYDDETPYQINANILSSTVEPDLAPGDVSILVGSSSDSASVLQNALTERGYRVSLSSLDDLPEPGVDVISLLDLELPFFHDISEERLKALQTYLATLPPDSSVLWVTGHAQVRCDDPRYAASIGAIRTIRSELSLDITTLEVDPRGDLEAQRVVDILHKIRRRSSAASGLDPDREFAVLEGKIVIPRYNWINVRKQSDDNVDEVTRKLETGVTGQLRSLRWVPENPRDLKDGEIEIEPRAVGLNSKDVMVAVGLVEPATPGLGLECAGVVRRLGPGVDGFAIGDRVMAFHHGSFASRIVVSTDQAVALPEALSFEEAATVPRVYSTAIHSLLTVGGLERDQTVLIHSACGGVGLAAIQICKMMGAKIYATVGSPEKVKVLVRDFGIPRDHIFSSRDSSFHSGIMEATDGLGVDLVLNSLSGELLHLSWKCVAKFGKMLELGQQDFVGHGALGMDVFEANRAFCGIDMSQLALERPKTLKRLLERCKSLLEQETIKPINPATTFVASDIVEAFKYLQPGSHIGKVVVTMPEDAGELPLAPIAPKPQFSNDAAYLLVGGLGGLGRAISTWMVENGARHLVYLSRSAGQSANDKAFIHELESQGCAVQCFTGRVEDPEAVTRAVQNASRPIAGVLHMSLVLSDRNVLNYTHEDWHAAVKPKVNGAWNLHHALSDSKLDFFVLFSSVSYVIGQSGQANYAAANAFLAAFAQYRHARGLPASVMDIGMVEDAGYLADNAAVLEQFKALHYQTLKEADLLEALAYSTKIQSSPLGASDGKYVNPAEIAVGLGSTRALRDPGNRVPWRRDARMAAVHVKGSVSDNAEAEPESQGLARFLGGLAADPSVLEGKETREFLTARIGEAICGMMMKDADQVSAGLPLAAIGVDSLVAIEIRDWWRRTFGLHVSVLEIMGAGGIRALGQMAVEGLKKAHSRGVIE